MKRTDPKTHGQWLNTGEGHLGVREGPEEGGVPAPRQVPQPRGLCQEEEFPEHIAVKSCEYSVVCPS